jgi:GABA(A) receptor-associated protein
MIRFKDQHNLYDRQKESERVIKKYPDRVPIICERSKTCKGISAMDKNKFLVPNDLTMGQFMYVIRKRLALPSEKAIFLFVNNTLVPTHSILGEIYEEQHDSDGFLYISYSDENVFGHLANPTTPPTPT